MLNLLFIVLVALAPETQPTTRPESNVPKIMADLRRQIADLSRQVDSLKNELALAHTEIRGLQDKLKRVADPTGPNADKIRTAISEHRLVVGMTMTQAKLSLDGPTWSGPRIVSEVGNRVTYEWWAADWVDDSGQRHTGGNAKLQAAFEQDRIVAVFNP